MRVIRESIGIRLDLSNVYRDSGMQLNVHWELVLCLINYQSGSS